VHQTSTATTGCVHATLGSPDSSVTCALVPTTVEDTGTASTARATAVLAGLAQTAHNTSATTTAPTMETALRASACVTRNTWVWIALC